MKRKIILLLTVILGVVLLAGLVSFEARAAEEEEPTPEEVCREAIKDLVDAGIDMGSFWEEDLDECWLRTSVEGSSCYPAFEVWEVNYYFIDSVQYWEWDSLGCIARYNHPTDSFKDPSYGFHYLNKPSGGTFEYEPRTCAGLCRIAVHALTIHAKEMLEEAPGRVLGKGYIQILDAFGQVDYGDFTFCLPAKGAKNPAFFRLGAGRQWYQITNGHWDINLYCMRGDMSGNYILVDLFYKPK